MHDKARNFYFSIAKPTADEFLTSCTDIRRGRLAAIVLFHMADYWSNACGSTPRRTGLDLAQTCPDFAIIRDVANATKHLILDGQPPTPRQLTSADQVTRPPGLFQAPFGEGGFAEACIVMITLDDMTTRSLADVVRSVVAMWETKLELPS